MSLKKATVIWFTGLSGSGKTTIAKALYDRLIKKGNKVLIFDGDKIRATIHRKLSFSKEDIKNNNLKIAEMIVEKQNLYDYILVPIISPFREHRNRVRKIIKSNFNELYVKCSIDKCIERDVKGLYKKAFNNEISNMIGFAGSNPYEPPLNPEIIIDTENEDILTCVSKVLEYIN